MPKAIEIHNVEKRFRLYHEKAPSLKERVIKFGRLEFEEFWALKGVSLDVESGQSLGLLGHNGSGKSTLLKCVAGILRPTGGDIRVHGRVAALLELGAGFHPDLTGRENVYLNGSILGFKKKEIDKIFDAIVDFSEIERFIDNQVKHYSSGMYARLAFAVAVHVEPEILLVDEVLAVGDEAFQKKCLARIERFRKEGRTILLVTHAADLVRRICDRAAVMDHGKLVAVDEPADAVATFRETLAKRGLEVPEEALDNPLWDHSQQVRITSVSVQLSDSSRSFLPSGDPMTVTVGFETRRTVDDVVFAVAILNDANETIYSANTSTLGLEPQKLSGRGTATFRFPSVPLLDGSYKLHLGAHSLDGRVSHDHNSDCTFVISSDTKSAGIVDLAPEAVIAIDGVERRATG